MSKHGPERRDKLKRVLDDLVKRTITSKQCRHKNRIGNCAWCEVLDK